MAKDSKDAKAKLVPVEVPPPAPEKPKAELVRFFGVAKIPSTGGYHVLEVELPLDDPRIGLATKSRLPRTQAWEAFMLRTRNAILAPTSYRSTPTPLPTQHGGGGH